MNLPYSSLAIIIALGLDLNDIGYAQPSNRNLSNNLFDSYEYMPKTKADVTLTISSTDVSFATDEPVLIDFVLENNDFKNPASVLGWVIPCFELEDDSNPDMPLDMSFFDIKTETGRAANYIGALIKRRKPTKADYKVLKPRDRIACTVNLSDYYEFDSADDDNNYEIQYSVVSMELSDQSLSVETSLEILGSNSISTKIDARNPPSQNRSVRERKLQASNVYRNCDSSRQTTLASARSQAATAAAAALVQINNVGQWASSANCPRYKDWFGNYASSRHTELRNGYQTTLNRLNDAVVTFDCGCSSSVYAYVYGNRPYEMWLCNLFWSAPMTGTDSKVGTIVHEMTHFIATAGTSDFAYGQSSCKSLAISNPTNAVNNADSHEYIAENTPALACSQTAPTPQPSCMAGSTRVEVESNIDIEVKNPEFKSVRDLSIGDAIQGLDKNLIPSTCTIEAVGHFGTGPVFGNYTEDHFILDASGGIVLRNGNNGDMAMIDKYAVLTSCPIGIDESGIGFTAVDSDLVGADPISWSDYVFVHEAILNIVKEVGPFVFSPSAYTSMDTVKQYTKKLYSTMLKCAKDPKKCKAFEKAAKDLFDKSLTEEAKAKVMTGLPNFGKFDKAGSISAAVSKGTSVRVRK